MNNKSVEDYLDLPYTIEFVRRYLRTQSSLSGLPPCASLRGCMTEADSFDEAAMHIRDAMRIWIEDALEAGDAVPEPRGEEALSGKFSVRLPKSLHRNLVHQAEREGVTLTSTLRPY